MVKYDPPEEGSSSDKKIGYANPPKDTRFTGSGNPAGRPKGSKNRKTIVSEVANETHTVTLDNKLVTLSTLELVLVILRNKVLEGGNPRLFDEYHRLLKKYQPQADGRGGYLVVPAPLERIEDGPLPIEDVDEDPIVIGPAFPKNVD